MNKSLRIAGLRMQRRLGWSGLAGVALLIASAGIMAWLPGTVDLEALARRVAQAEAHAHALRQHGPYARQLL